MGGERPFDDDRWPDEEGFAVCFLCGKKVDPLDPKRCLYTPNAKACAPIPAHLSCLAEAVKDPLRLQVTGITAIQQMGEATIRMMRRAAALEEVA